LKVFSIVGNRPQFIKAAPTSLALREQGLEEVVLHTGQHYDRELSQVFFDDLELDEPRYALDLRTADPETLQAAIGGPLRQEEPEWVLVYGDTNSTLAGALAAVDAQVPFAHVEAGLRSGDLSMPEERNRIEADRRARRLFCPDERSRDQLEKEGVPGDAEVVGDVMADATRLFAPIASERVDVGRLAPERPFHVLTIHREANTEPERLHALIDTLNATEHTFVFPVHPRTRHVFEEHGIEPAPHLHPIAPVGYLEMLALVAAARAVVTDSGGLQKEAYWLRVPCVTLRPETEWVDTVLAGGNTLLDPAEAGRLGEVLDGVSFPADAPELYGDGRAAERIARSLYTFPPT
jgi:UDP-N-acetylglucosamine 2-epimerase